MGPVAPGTIYTDRMGLALLCARLARPGPKRYQLASLGSTQELDLWRGQVGVLAEKWVVLGSARLLGCPLKRSPTPTSPGSVGHSPCLGLLGHRTGGSGHLLGFVT